MVVDTISDATGPSHHGILCTLSQPRWMERPPTETFDFHFETSLSDSHIAEKKDQIKCVLENGEMPYWGVTVLHEEGVELMVEYLDSV